MDRGGIWVCLVLFFVHYYNFAVQETITTPFVLAAYQVRAAGGAASADADRWKYIFGVLRVFRYTLCYLCFGIDGHLITLPCIQSLPAYNVILTGPRPANVIVVRAYMYAWTQWDQRTVNLLYVAVGIRLGATTCI